MDEKNNHLAAAKRMMEHGDFENAHRTLRPLVDAEIPEALFLYSTFSLAGTESDAAFEKRSVDMLTRAAHLGHAAAMYSVGVCFENGDLVEKDVKRAAHLYSAAAEAGDSRAKFRHGLNLLYGSGGMRREEVAGRALIRIAAAEGIEEAKEHLERQDDAS